ncbi:MAG: DUF5752 family protein [bacterium]|nr:DUF5752 family protein [bacterium]
MEKFLQDVPEHNYFWVLSGLKLKNLVELAGALETMTDEVFNYHVNESKNDFACWIKECIKDTALAEALLATKSKKDIAKKVKDRVAEIQKPKAEIQKPKKDVIQPKKKR